METTMDANEIKHRGYPRKWGEVCYSKS